jgi:phosphatidylglycerol:prolipoprotein diacylglycerol transferase
MVFPNAFPPGVPRHPSQLYEAGMEGILLFLALRFLMLRVQLHRVPGAMIASFLTLYGLFRFVGEFFRDSESKIYGWFSMGQALSLPMWIAAAFLFWYAFSQRPKKALT